MTRLGFIVLMISCSFTSLCFSQIVVPEWELPVTHGISATIESSFGDNYGTHVLVPEGADFSYKLLGNDGNLVPGTISPIIPKENLTSASVASYNGVISVIAYEETNPPRLRIFQSSDGGQSWSDNFFILPSGVTVLHLDAYANSFGVHTTWDNELQNRVYYARYAAGGWTGLQEVTDISGPTGRAPKVISTGDKLVVGFINVVPPTDPEPFHLAISRDLDSIYARGSSA